MATFTTEGIVLRSYLLGEADKILTIFSPDRGKFRAVVKGARRAKSRLVGVAEPLCCSTLHGSTGRNLDIITQAEVRAIFGGIRRDLVRTSWAQYAAELVDLSVGDGQSLPRLYDVLLGHLVRLDSGGEPEVLTRAFELAALQQLGYGPQLQECSACGEPPGEAWTSFSPRHGGLLCAACGAQVPGTVRLSRGALESIRVLARGDDRAVMSLRLSGSARAEIEDANLGFLAYHLERVPKSLEFARSVSEGGIHSG